MTVVESAKTSRDAKRSLPPSTRERILTASYCLFAGRGIRDVSIDEIIAVSGVAKATLYRHFPSKDDLVLAFLDRREQQWTFGTVAAGARELSDEPEGQLLAIFDVFDDWFRRDDFEACSFVKILLELGTNNPVGQACIKHLATVSAFVTQLAVSAKIPDADEFSRSWSILIKGSIVQAAEGDTGAAKRAQGMGRLLIAQSRLAVA
ncbi:MAG: TetR/AcrR family transcriptional regulator [Microbacteriaceae bacterium]